MIGVWQLITLTDDGHNLIAYINGNVVGTAEKVATGSVTSYPLYIGYDPGGEDDYFNGAIDDVRIYNRALTAAEVKALYDGTGGMPTKYTVTFDLNGADGAAPAKRSVAEGTAIGELPEVTRTGYTFLGWFTAASGGTQVTAATVVTGNATYYAQWKRIMYMVTFDLNGADGAAPAKRSVAHGAAVGELPKVSRNGYTFAGWFTAASGGTKVTAATVVTGNATYYAQWKRIMYMVTFDLNGADGAAPAKRSVAEGAAIGELPKVACEGYEFLGWFTAKTGGTRVTASTKVTANVTYYAQWQAVADENTLWDEDDAFSAEAAATFDGFLTKDGEVKGLVQVKAGRANKGTGVAKLSANVTLLGKPTKLSYKGVFGKPGATGDFTPGTASLTCSGQPGMSLRIGRNALWGEMGGYEIEGSRNVFEKAGNPKASALSKWQGTYTLALETVDVSGAGFMFAWGYSGLTVSVGAKGKVKVQGTMVDGAKVNVASQLLVGEKRCCIPVVVPLYSKKGGFGFNLWLQADGAIEAGEMGAWDATASKTPFTAWFGENVPAARTATSLPASMSFMLVGEPYIDDILYDFLPWEVQFAGGGRWTVPAAGIIKYDKGKDEYYDAKESANPAGLKLTYVSKLGTFKGTFKMYAGDSAGRLKKLTANVSGVMAGRQGYGTATVKGVGSWPVSIQ